MKQQRVLASALVALVVAACSGDGKISEPQRPPSQLTALAAVGTDPITGATIETNQDDYLPGEVVHVQGRGWAPNEIVHLFMTEDPDTHDDVSRDVQADATGTFSFHFYDVQAHDLGVTFTLTATGQSSGSVATAVFTDGRPVNSITLNGSPTVTVPPSASISALVSGELTGNSNNTLGSLRLQVYLDGSTPTSSVVNVCFDVNPDQGPSAAPNQIPFAHTIAFTGPSTGGVYDVAATSYSDDGCAVAGGSNTHTVDKGITVQVANAAPTLDPIGNKSVGEGSLLSFTATASDTDLPSQALSFSLIGAPAGAAIVANTGAFSWTPTDGPSQTATFKVRVTDNGTPNLFAEEEITVTVNNVAPTATFNAPTSVAAGANINLSLTGVDDASSVDEGAGFTYAFDCGAGDGYGSFSGTSTATCATTSPGSRTVRGKVRDKDLGETEYTASVAVDNVPPQANAGGDYSGDEGSSIDLTGTGSDPDGGTVTYAWTVAPIGACVIASPTAASTTVTCNDNGAWTLTLEVTDDEGAKATGNATLTVHNVAPTINVKTAGGNVNEGSTIAFAVSNVTDPSTADVAAGFTYAFACNGTTFGAFGASSTVNCPAGDGPGSVTIAAKAKDKNDGESAIVSSTFTVVNVAPIVDAGSATATINEGDTFSRLGSYGDPGPDTWTATVDYGDGAGPVPLGLAADKTFNLNHTYPNDGVFTVTVTVTDDDGEPGSDQITVTVNNVLPVVSAGAGTTINEGTTFTRNGSFTDPGADTWTATVDYGDGSGVAALTLSGKTFALSHTYVDDTGGPFTITVKVNDDDGFGSTTVLIDVENTPPTLNSVVGSAAPVAANTSTIVTFDFSDPALTNDTYTASVDWGDGNTSSGAVTPGGSLGHTYTSAGVYTVCARVSDEDGGTSAEKCYMYVVVYDPSAGFVTGGGWINSPAGAYKTNAALTGKANFGFVSKYKKGQSTPDGNTEFQFHAGNLNFKSTTYEWLVVSGAKAQFKGTGTVNGSGNYGFLLSAIDGQASGGGGMDKFRIKIWDKNDGDTIVYDNLLALDTSDTADPTTTLGGGSIVIHSGK